MSDAHQGILALINKKSKSYEDKKNIVKDIRVHQLKMQDVVLQYGLDLVKNHKSQLGSEIYLIYEDLFYAAIDNNCYEVSDKSYRQILQRYPTANKSYRMRAIQEESLGHQEMATKIYKHILNDNQLNLEASKRLIQQLRVEGDIKNAILELNKFLESHSQDEEAWLELADIYIENLQYQKAIFCYEELLLINPHNIHYLTKLAELLYSLGGNSNFQMAKNYYCHILCNYQENVRALWGLMQTLKNMKPANQELIELTFLSIQNAYEQKNMAHLIKNYKLSHEN